MKMQIERYPVEHLEILLTSEELSFELSYFVLRYVYMLIESPHVDICVLSLLEVNLEIQVFIL
ncbi:uncharacterized protein DS421_10g296120 [Arachis hypogaea]|nr:uncharacterized protein DS421_10g296120 [Arachis hypogaea]